MSQIPRTGRRALLALLIAPAAFAQPGALDPTFGSGDGFVLTDLGAEDSAGGVALLPDGRAVVVGSSDGDLALARYLPDGTLDATFGTGGAAVTDFGDGESNHAHAAHSALQPDGKFVVAGRVGWFFTGAARALLGRYLPDGTPDATFGDGGFVLLDPDTSGGATAVVLQPDGKILLGGQGEQHGLLARYLPDGTPDATFGDGGFTEVPLTALSGVALQPDGRIVAAGYTGWWGDRVVAALRLNPDGGPDATFGTGGLATTDLDPYAYGAAVAVRPDGAVLLLVHYLRELGLPYAYYDRGYGLLQYLPDGTLDPAFGTDGVVGLRAAMEQPFALALQPDGKALVLGIRQATRDAYVILARHHADGSADPGFGDGGVARGWFGGAHGGAFGLALQPDGRILAAGFSGTLRPGTTGHYDFLLARYLGGSAVRPASDSAPVAASEVPAALALSAPSPHPFRAGARITLSVPTPQPVRVAVYDALGREVAVLLDGTAEAGTHMLTLGGGALAAGVYVVRAEGADGAAARRVVRH